MPLNKHTKKTIYIMNHQKNASQNHTEVLFIIAIVVLWFFFFFFFQRLFYLITLLVKFKSWCFHSHALPPPPSDRVSVYSSGSLETGCMAVQINFSLYFPGYGIKGIYTAMPGCIVEFQTFIDIACMGTDDMCGDTLCVCRSGGDFVCSQFCYICTGSGDFMNLLSGLSCKQFYQPFSSACSVCVCVCK